MGPFVALVLVAPIGAGASVDRPDADHAESHAALPMHLEHGEFVHETCLEPFPVLPAATALAEPLPAWMLSDAAVLHLQVNRDVDGMNILGDAANEPTIAVDLTAPNRMAIAWRQFDTVDSSFRQAGYSWSVDGGRTWSAIDRIDPGVFRSDPVLVPGPDGAFHFPSLLYDTDWRVEYHRSMDGGRTWSEGVPAFGGDKQWLALHPNGETLFHHWTSSANRSFDGGVTWETPVQSVPLWGNSVFGPDGAWYIAGHESGQIKLIRVDDPLADEFVLPEAFGVTMNGTLASWSGPNPNGLLGMPQVVVNHAAGPHEGEVYVIAVTEDWQGGWTLPDSCNLEFNRSTDRGETWLSEPIMMSHNSNRNYGWMGTMSIAPNGRLDLVWLDTKNAPPNYYQAPLSELFYSFSPDGGRTWSPTFPLSVAFDSWLGWPQQNKMGDYFHMVSDDVGADLAWAATFEGEQNVYYTRIGPRDCDRNGIADQDDLATGALRDCDGDGVPDACEIAAGVVVPCAVCPADLAEPFGVIDMSDLVAFVTSFGNGASTADLAEPFGVLDLGDLVAFVTAFEAGCP